MQRSSAGVLPVFTRGGRLGSRAESVCCEVDGVRGLNHRFVGVVELGVLPLFLKRHVKSRARDSQSVGAPCHEV